MSRTFRRTKENPDWLSTERELNRFYGDSADLSNVDKEGLKEYCNSQRRQQSKKIMSDANKLNIADLDLLVENARNTANVKGAVWKFD